MLFNSTQKLYLAFSLLIISVVAVYGCIESYLSIDKSNKELIKYWQILDDNFALALAEDFTVIIHSLNKLKAYKQLNNLKCTEALNASIKKLKVATNNKVSCFKESNISNKHILNIKQISTNTLLFSNFVYPYQGTLPYLASITIDVSYILDNIPIHSKEPIQLELALFNRGEVINIRGNQIDKALYKKEIRITDDISIIYGYNYEYINHQKQSIILNHFYSTLLLAISLLTLMYLALYKYKSYLLKENVNFNNSLLKAKEELNLNLKEVKTKFDLQTKSFKTFSLLQDKIYNRLITQICKISQENPTLLAQMPINYIMVHMHNIIKEIPNAQEKFSITKVRSSTINEIIENAIQLIGYGAYRKGIVITNKVKIKGNDLLKIDQDTFEQIIISLFNIIYEEMIEKNKLVIRSLELDESINIEIRYKIIEDFNQEKITPQGHTKKPFLDISSIKVLLKMYECTLLERVTSEYKILLISLKKNDIQTTVLRSAQNQNDNILKFPNKIR